MDDVSALDLAACAATTAHGVFSSAASSARASLRAAARAALQAQELSSSVMRCL